MEPMELTVLGTRYTIEEATPAEDPALKHCEGYTDKSSHRIVVAAPEDHGAMGLDDWSACRKHVLRHEILHAFLFESGLHGCANWVAPEEEHPEQMVDWFAAQFPKLLEAYKAAGAI